MKLPAWWPWRRKAPAPLPPVETDFRENDISGTLKRLAEHYRRVDDPKVLLKDRIAHAAVAERLRHQLEGRGIQLRTWDASGAAVKAMEIERGH